MSIATALAKRSEDRLAVVKVAKSGTITLELTRRGRVYTTKIPADDSVTMIEAAAMCSVSRSTVYNWGKKSAGWYAQEPMTITDGRVELPELRRYLTTLGTWWLRDHEAAGLIADHGPVREKDK